MVCLVTGYFTTIKCNAGISRILPCRGICSFGECANVTKMLLKIRKTLNLTNDFGSKWRVFGGFGGVNYRMKGMFHEVI